MYYIVYFHQNGWSMDEKMDSRWTLSGIGKNG